MKKTSIEQRELFPPKGLGGSSHGSTLTEGSDGTIYGAWYSGTKENAADVKIWMTSKPPQGEWQEPWLVEKEGETSKNPFICGEENPEELAELDQSIILVSDFRKYQRQKKYGAEVWVEAREVGIEPTGG